MKAERCRGDHSETSERADHQLRQIEARDILHDLAAAVCNDAVGPDDGDADDQIANRSVAGSQRPKRIRSDDAPNRGVTGEGRVESQTLAVRSDHFLQTRESRARLDRDDLIRRSMFDEAIEVFGSNDEVEARMRV